MDKNAVKKFAVNARRKLIDSVSQKAYGLGISIDEIKEVEQIPNGSRIKINNDYVYLTDIETQHRERLIEQIKYKGYEQVMEEVAYTWFNRIIAIRFMEVNEYLPTRVRVLSSEDENKVEPDAVTQALDLVEDLGLNTEEIYNYQDDNDIEGLFKYIFIKQCNALGKIMPVMFEKIQDYTELLLPDNLLVEGSVIRDLINDIEEDDFKDQVQIIGWLYQYYISEKKDEVFNGLKKNKKITKENIPAATQLFTPDWIVKYMVENSLGRLWLEGHPNETLKSEWKYYLEEAEQEPDVEKELEKIREDSKNLSPEDITVLDPAMGSGHILVYAFDVLYQIYLSDGYSERDIPRLILEKNLYGLDIDDRAGQLAYFALIMKARSYSRRFFREIEREPIELNVCAIQESNGISEEDIECLADGDEELKKDVKYLVEIFADAKDYGAILKVEEVNFEKIKNRILYISTNLKDLFTNNIKNNIIKKLSIMNKQSYMINMKYSMCLTNPPYMGTKGMNKNMAKYISKIYPYSKGDLFAIFMELCESLTKYNGFTSIINQQSWMFLSSFEKLRKKYLDTMFTINMIHLGSRAFEENVGTIVQTTAFITRKNNNLRKYKGKYINLTDNLTSNDKEKALKKIARGNCEINVYLKSIENFNGIPGIPLAYWISNNITNLFKNNDNLESIAKPRQGLATSDNERFLRGWYEVNIKKINFACKSIENAVESDSKWFPYNKGGKYRKWFGNNEFIINWENNGEEVKDYAKQLYKSYTRTIKNISFYFKECITYTFISEDMGVRYSPYGFIFDVAGSSIFIEGNNLFIILGYLASKVSSLFLDILNPTFNIQVGDVKKIPIVKDMLEVDNSNIICLVKENIDISINEWDLYEISWNFKKHPIIEFKSNNIKNTFKNWSGFAEKQFNQLKSNEEELNKNFIDIYGLQDELTPEVEDKDITIRKADRDREMKSFISYAVGCMMGRYCLDEEGLVFAGGKFDINRYKTFKADKDAIIPITDMEYFEDDIVSKFVEFVKVVFGEETLEENLNYIADTECFKRKSNETSRDCLRRYFLKGFMEDHVKLYQKRPIYWMFDSGKQNGFKALIYMHRYDENMVAKVRTDYLHVLQRKYEFEINRLDNDINSDILSTKEKTSAKKRKEKIQKQLAECKQYDQVISHVAHQRIVINLDDGVKVNYQKFQGIEVPQGNAKKDLKQDLLFKVKM